MQSSLDHETIIDKMPKQKTISKKTRDEKWKNEHDTSKKVPIY